MRVWWVLVAWFVECRYDRRVLKDRIVRVLISFTRRLNISQAAVNVLVFVAILCGVQAGGKGKG